MPKVLKPGRKGLKPGQNYFITNIAEPYAEDIYEVVKRNHPWG